MSGPVGSSQWMYASGGYEIDQSIRFEDGRSTYLHRTPASDGNRRTWTLSYWIKRGNIVDHKSHFGGSMSGGSERIGVQIQFDGGTQMLMIVDYRAGYQVDWVVKSDMGFRETGAWYHIVIAIDTTQGTAANRVKLYANGVRLSVGTSYTPTYPSQNFDTKFNQALIQTVGAMSDGLVPTNFYEGYMSDVHFIDGLQLTPSSFGETGDYGEWKPKDCKDDLTYGTNGYYLPFKQDYSVEGFSVLTYKGNGETSAHGRYIGGVGFSPDVQWTKQRDDTATHFMTFANITYNKHHRPSTNTEETAATSRIEGWEPDGYKIGHYSEVNAAAGTYVSWNWDMGGSDALNEDGSEDVYVRANTTYGQSVVTYTGTGSTATFGHGLDSAPDFGIIHGRSNSGDWMVYFGDNTDYLKLNENYAREDSAAVWNDTSPSSTVFTLGNNGDLNVSGRTYVSLWFHDVTGYSKFGQYSGTAGTHTVTTGFEPAFLLTKRLDSADHWRIVDNARSPSNTGSKVGLKVNLNEAEGDVGSRNIDFISTGFTVIDTDPDTNANGGTYFYAAFADMREYAYWLDQSGNNNDFTSFNLTESDVSKDTPTNNYCTWNDNANEHTALATLSEGSLKGATGQDYNGTCSTFNIHQDGKSYMEFWTISLADDIYMGIAASNEAFSGLKLYDTDPSYAYRSDGLLIYGGGSNTSTSIATFGHGDIIQLAVDTTANKLWIGKNNTWQMAGTQNPSTGDGGYSITDQPEGYTVIFGTGSNNSTNIGIANFGQDSSFAGHRPPQGNGAAHEDFYYAPPTGFKSLCAKNLPVPIIPSEHFSAYAYTGNAGASPVVTGTFQPDFIWVKDRGNNEGNVVVDAMRGFSGGNANIMRTHSSNGNYAGYANGINAFTSTGFTTGGADDGVSNSSRNYISWNWKANGSGSANTDGTINSTVSVNDAAGFSMVTYVGVDSQTTTVGHGLSKAPEWVIVKAFSEDGRHWRVFYGKNTHYQKLNDSPAEVDDDNYWNDTSPTSTVFSVGDANDVNDTGCSFIAYCFYSVEGYSKLGTYIGNGNANGTFVYLGFRPAFVMTKKLDNNANGSSWCIYDKHREGYNNTNDTLRADTSGAEDDTGRVELYSNGFKMRVTYAENNENAVNFIYMAFADVPFKYANGR